MKSNHKESIDNRLEKKRVKRTDGLLDAKWVLKIAHSNRFRVRLYLCASIDENLSRSELCAKMWEFFFFYKILLLKDFFHYFILIGFFYGRFMLV